LTTRGKLTAGGKFFAGVTRMNVDFEMWPPMSTTPAVAGINETNVLYTKLLAQITTGYFPDFFKSLASPKKKKPALKKPPKMKNTSTFETNTSLPS
jgi:hypothetical protein